MSASYNSKLPTHLDWVRFLVGDTDVDNAQVQDEEIRAVLQDHIDGRTDGTWVRYLAAADIMETLLARWITAGGGIVEKWVSKLRLRRGVMDSAEGVLRRRIESLRIEAAARRTPKPHVFEIL